MKQIYFHEQTTPSSTWLIVHNFGRIPNTDVQLSTGEKILPLAVVAVDLNSIEIRFSSPRIGTANLVG